MQSRRMFLRQAGFTTASLLMAERIMADPYHPLTTLLPMANHVRIRGVVRSRGRGVPSVAVTDGRSVVRTNADGTFDIKSTSLQEFVSISLPSGYSISKSVSGTALFYQAITPGPNGEMTAQFDIAQLAVPDTRHAFFQLADPQTLDDADISRFRHETVPDVSMMARELDAQPMFGVACGDILYDRLEYFPEYEKAVKEMGMAFFQVIGNHDVDIAARTDEASAATFRKTFGPTYYSFNRGEIHYVVLDDVFWYGGYMGYFDQAQLDWLQADLSFIEKGRTVVVFTHIPPYNEQHLRIGAKSPSNSLVVTNRELLYRILEPYKPYVLTGHMHESEYLRDGGVEIHVNGAVCGAWWTANICHDGTPNGYSVYEVNGSELKWRYKSVGKPIDHQMTIYPKGSNPDHPDETFANIWGADRSWEVTWYEDGVKKGSMERHLGNDPEAVKLFTGSDLPHRHKWIEPIPADHFFYAKPGTEAKEIMVEAKDGGGRIYTGRMKMGGM